MDNTYKLIHEYLKAKADVESVEEVLKMRKKQAAHLAEQLAELWQDQQLGKVEMRGKRVSAKYEPRYNIQGGRKDSAKRTEVVGMLEELGFADKVNTFKDMHEKDFKKAMDSLSDEVLAKLIKDKLISVHSVPVITVRTIKGEKK